MTVTLKDGYLTLTLSLALVISTLHLRSTIGTNSLADYIIILIINVYRS